MGAETYQSIDLESFGDFLAHAERIKTSVERRFDKLLYRGQANAEWGLESTLDRRFESEIPMANYFAILSRTLDVYSSVTEKNIKKYDYSDLKRYFEEYDSFSLAGFSNKIPYLGELVKFRHFGFLSPLLDWTQSPYIAAFFAFREMTNAEKISIYLYDERPTNMKLRGSGTPQIIKFSNYATGGIRHYIQQAEYTLCVNFITEEGRNFWRFNSYNYFFEPKDQYLINQDVIYKFDLPASLRIQVLRLLDQMNINAYSLFGTEEALMETLEMREVHFKSA